MKTKVLVLMAGLLVMGMSTFFASPVLPAGTTLSETVDCYPHYTRTFNWTIDKSVAPDAWDLFKGDAGTSQFTITVTKDAGTDAAWIDGEICVTNGGAVATENLTFTIDLTNGLPPPNDWLATYSVDISSHPVLLAGETFCYSFSAVIPAADIHPSGPYKIWGHPKITNHAGHMGTPYGPNEKCDEILPASPTLINDIIHMDDTNGGSWTFNASGSVSYPKTFSCDGDVGTHSNTATIRETGQFDGASVTVNCYALEIEKDAHTSFTRTYNWTIDESADQSALILSIGQIFTGVHYSVNVDATYLDSDWAVSGTITVHNPAPIPATINSISDVVSGVGAATVTCSVSFPYTLAAGGTLNCAYSASLPNADSRTNTATATLQNYSYDYLMNGTPTGTTDFSGSANVVFGAPTTEVDESIDVSDPDAVLLGTVCYPNVPTTFTYSRNIGPYNVCGDYTVENPASFETNDTRTTGSDSWPIYVHVPCGGGCTLTQGYWKTHSEFGPAPYDDTWAMLPNGASTIFFRGGTWYTVLWTSPSGNSTGNTNNCNKPGPGTPPVSNAYYILAHQYMAAKLNILNGASSTPAVDAAIAWAQTQFFNSYTPLSSLSKIMSQQAISYANLFAQYNSGLIGPGHCSEDGISLPKAGESGEDNHFVETRSPMPDAYALAQNYPNPFNPSTTFGFDLPKTTEVKLKIYNITGQKVATVFSGVLNAGHYTFIWQAPENLASGVYFYKLETEEFTTVKKMSFLK